MSDANKAGITPAQSRRARKKLHRKKALALRVRMEEDARKKAEQENDFT